MITDRESRFITLSTAFTPVIRRGRHPIISPDEDSPSLPPTNLNNQFAAIAPSQQPDVSDSDSDSDSDDDNDQSSQGTIQPVTSDDDDDDYGTTTMSTIHSKTITDLMTEVIPITPARATSIPEGARQRLEDRDVKRDIDGSRLACRDPSRSQVAHRW